MDGIKKIFEFIQMEKIILLSVLGIIFISGCTQTSEQIDDFDLYYCEKDADCIVTYYDTNKCCEATCAVFAFNNKTIENMKVWRELNCDFSKETRFTDDKWIDCAQLPYYEFAECNIDKIRKTIAICKNNKCYGAVENTSIDISKIKKQILSPKIINNDSYCTGRKDNPNCICQEGYFKWTLYDHNDCIPLICKYIEGYTSLSDDLLGPNIEFCEWATRDKKPDVCDSISYQVGKDICILAYVGLTNDTSACIKIEDEHLKNECYK